MTTMTTTKTQPADATIRIAVDVAGLTTNPDGHADTTTDMVTIPPGATLMCDLRIGGPVSA
jgi:hypothetical protein